MIGQVNHSRYTTHCAPKYPDDAKSYAHMALAMLICYLVPMVVIIVCSGISLHSNMEFLANSFGVNTLARISLQAGYMKSQHTDDKSPLKGRGQGHATHFKFWGPVIYLERFKLELSNCAYR